MRGSNNKKQQKRSKAATFFMATLVMWGMSVGFEIAFNNKKELLPLIFSFVFFQIANSLLRYWVSREPLFVNTSVSLLHSSLASTFGNSTPLFSSFQFTSFLNFAVFWFHLLKELRVCSFHMNFILTELIRLYWNIFLSVVLDPIRLDMDLLELIFLR